MYYQHHRPMNQIHAITWRRVLEYFIFFQLLKKFFSLCGALRFTNVFTAVTTRPYPMAYESIISRTAVLISSFYLLLNRPNSLFHLYVRSAILRVILIPFKHAVCPASLLPCYLNIPKCFMIPSSFLN